MWISKEICENKKNFDKSDIGKVSGVANNSVTVQGKQEYRGIPLLLPFGLATIPQEGSKVVVMQTERGFVCSGIGTPGVKLNPGEVMLYSAGGASIVLKNNGQVLINGRVQ